MSVSVPARPKNISPAIDVYKRQAPDAVARPLNIENVLWAGWDPAATTPRIAYTTARSTTLPPGWEANNDLWLLELPVEGPQPAPVRLGESYATAYAWWGGQYAWSGDGRLAYAFADEVGVLAMPTAEEAALLDPTTAGWGTSWSGWAAGRRRCWALTSCPTRSAGRG